jgi:hypothetical protein
LKKKKTLLMSYCSPLIHCNSITVNHLINSNNPSNLPNDIKTKKILESEFNPFLIFLKKMQFGPF